MANKMTPEKYMQLQKKREQAEKMLKSFNYEKEQERALYFQSLRDSEY